MSKLKRVSSPIYTFFPTEVEGFDGLNDGDPVCTEMTRGRQPVGAENGYIYSAQVQAARPASDYTARVIPHRSGVAIPLEPAEILWQR